ncbi:hypothetical protein QSH39_021910, partial [Xanthomonas arboricola pv. corylina]
MAPNPAKSECTSHASQPFSIAVHRDIGKLQGIPILTPGKVEGAPCGVKNQVLGDRFRPLGIPS